MDLEALEKFCQEKGLEISKVLLEKYDSTDFDVSGREIEREIYEVATSYATIFIFEARQFLEEAVREEVKAHLSSRFDSKQIEKIADVTMIAHWIKSEAIRELENVEIFLI